VSSTGALALKAVPEHMLLWRGYIGLEMGSVGNAWEPRLRLLNLWIGLFLKWILS